MTPRVRRCLYGAAVTRIDGCARSVWYGQLVIDLEVVRARNTLYQPRSQCSTYIRAI